MPERGTLCGLPAASSEIDKAPERAPVTVGVKVTLTVQFAPAAKVPPQVELFAKSPVIPIEEMVNRADPVLVSVTD